MLEDENDKQVHTSTGEILKKNDIIRDKNYKQVRRSTGQPSKKKVMFRGKKGKQVRTYADVVSTGNLSSEKERQVF